MTGTDLATLQAEVEAVSTFGQARFLRRTFLQQVENNLGTKWVDPLSPLYAKLLATEIETTPYTYTGHEPITTVCYKIYGTTSLWHVVLYVNGHMHPQEIPTGSVLNMPTLEFIERFVRDNLEQANSLVGTTEVI